jgi:hypothetical protein
MTEETEEEARSECSAKMRSRKIKGFVGRRRPIYRSMRRKIKNIQKKTHEQNKIQNEKKIISRAKNIV